MHKYFLFVMVISTMSAFGMQPSSEDQWRQQEVDAAIRQLLPSQKLIPQYFIAFASAEMQQLADEHNATIRENIHKISIKR